MKNHLASVGSLLALFAFPALSSAQCPISFASAVNFGAGLSPSSVAVGDFNSDGKPDLAVANNQSDDVSILLGNGGAGGTFQAAVNYPVSGRPTCVAVGDFNGDGILDLAVTNWIGNVVAILRGNGGGTFQAAVNYSVGGFPSSVAVGDFNRDGSLDLAVANSANNNVSVLLNNGGGSGTFQAAVNYDVDNGFGVNPSSIAVGDLNGDGILDLAVALETAFTVQTLLGNADGTFRTRAEWNTAVNPTSVVLGDFNGDSKLDVATADIGGGIAFGTGVSIGLGRGDGVFFQPIAYYQSYSANSVAVGDFNGDGKLDLAFTSYYFQRVTIMMGNGDGTLQGPVERTVGVSPSSVAVGDFDGDGRPDLVVANGVNDVSVLLNTAPIAASITQQPAAISTCPAGTATFSVAAAGTGPFTYQWQWQQVGLPGAWVNVAEGANTDTGGVVRFTALGAHASEVQIARDNHLQGAVDVIQSLRCIVTNTCGSVTSNPATVSVCRADFDCDGVVTSQDFFDFIHAFFSGMPAADFDHDGNITSQDFFDFLEAFFTGCP